MSRSAIRIAKRRSFTVAILMCGGALLSGSAGCDGGGSGNNRKTQSGMVKSSGQFQKGYQDGSRDAQRSLGDWNGAAMWLWMADGQYKNGYDRGWNDGRQMAKLKSYQGKQMGGREPLTPAPSLLRQQQSQEQTPAPKPTPSRKAERS